MSKVQGGELEVVTDSSGKGVADDAIDLTASPQSKKARTGQKDIGRGEPLEKDIVSEVDVAYRQSF